MSSTFESGGTEGVRRELGEERARSHVAVVAYNEADTISGVVSEAQTVADEVFVVDDGSTDGTAGLAREVGVPVVRHPTNLGYGAALKTAFREAARRDPAHLVTIDGDGQHDPQDVRKLVEAQRETGADLVVGSRYRHGGSSDIPLYRRLGLGLVNAATNLSLAIGEGQVPISDTQCGLRAYRPALYRSLASDADIGDSMEASTDILYHAVEHGYDIEEVGVRVRYDLPNTSSKNPVIHGLKLLANIVRYAARRRLFVFPALAVVLGVQLVRKALSLRHP